MTETKATVALWGAIVNAQVWGAAAYLQSGPSPVFMSVAWMVLAGFILADLRKLERDV